MHTASAPPEPDAGTNHSRVVEFIIRCRWHRATAPPSCAMKKLLKVLGRLFQAPAMSCSFHEITTQPAAGLDRPQPAKRETTGTADGPAAAVGEI